MHCHEILRQRFTAACLTVLLSCISLFSLLPARAASDASSTAIFQPDLMIKAPTDESFVGENIVNDVDDETCTQASSAGLPAVFLIRLRNIGTAQDSFTITGSAGSAGNVVRYYAAASGGADITCQVTGDGWTSPLLSPGSCLDLRAEITLHPLVLLATPETFVVTAISCSDTAKSDSVTALTYKSPLIALQVQANTTAAVVNTPITLTAMPIGGVNVEYKFRLGYANATGWHWSDLRGYGGERTLRWTPGSARAYTVLALAREAGSTSAFQAYASLPIEVSPRITAVTLNASPAAPQAAVTPVMLSATATGGSRVEYQFSVGYHNATGWHWTILSPYSPAQNCLWLPDYPRLYLLAVAVREAGQADGAAQMTRTVSYKINP